MAVIRSILFNIFYVVWSIGVGTFFLPVMLLPRAATQFGVARLWLGGFIWAAKVFLGLRYEVRGRENLPDGPVILAAKHQSAFDTFLFHFIVRDPIFVLKKELTRIPLVGWYLLKSGQIAVDRKAGASALKLMVKAARAASAAGGQIIIYPEGTRTAPGTDAPYHSGVAALYTQLGIPVVPVALNSGCFWPRNSFVKTPGTMVVQILPPLPPGMPRKEFLATLRSQIEMSSCTLAGLPPPAAPSLPSGPSSGPSSGTSKALAEVGQTGESTDEAAGENKAHTGS